MKGLYNGAPDLILQAKCTMGSALQRPVSHSRFQAVCGKRVITAQQDGHPHLAKVVLVYFACPLFFRGKSLDQPGERLGKFPTCPKTGQTCCVQEFVGFTAAGLIKASADQALNVHCEA